MAAKKTSSRKVGAKDTPKPEVTKPKLAKTDTRQDGAKPASKKPTVKPKPLDSESPSSARQPATPHRSNASPATLLERAEADMTRLLESLNTQMATAMHAFTELAASHRGKHEAVIRTKPLDRATAMFQRLVTEVVDERIGEILPTMVALRSEMNQRAKLAAGSPDDDPQLEFLTRGGEMLDQVLANFDVHGFDPQVGDAFDPLIHLAVGEAHRDDLPADVVAEVFQSGFRSTRGKVVQAARVKVNRR